MTRSTGSPSASADITGGLSWRGVGNLEEFVRQGGVLVTLGGASTLSLDGGIARCRATTRKGKPCQRTPLPERDYCPSHQHLETKAAA